AGICAGDGAGGGGYRRWVRRFLPGKEVLLLRLAARPLGWLVAKGNPAGFSGAEDLSRRGIRFINRQEGSGTRLFLDRLLRENGIDPSTVDGYDREVLSPWEVAAAVEEGSADVGLGTLALARRVGLDFLPLREERKS